MAAADVLALKLTDLLGAADVEFLIADFSGQALIRLGHGGNGAATRTQGQESAEAVPLSDSAHGRVLASQDTEVVNGLHGANVVAPVTNRGEAIGVLELRLPHPPDDQALADIALAAELQHRLLPGSHTCEARQFTLAGWLEPAGDTFDFTLDRET